MNLLLSTAANTDVKQPITNLKQRISANTNVTSKNLKFAEDGFSAQMYVI